MPAEYRFGWLGLTLLAFCAVAAFVTLDACSRPDIAFAAPSA